MTFKSEAEPEHASCVGVTGVDEVYTAELKCSSTAPLSVAFAAAVRALTLHHSARIWMNRTVLTLWHLQVALTVANCVNFHAFVNEVGPEGGKAFGRAMPYMKKLVQADLQQWPGLGVGLVFGLPRRSLPL